MAADYVLFYWPLPFRGQFVRYVLAHLGVRWEEPPTDALIGHMHAPVAEQPVPFMAPPVIQDRHAGLWLSQMPAILAYLGDKHALYPGEPAKDALTNTIIGNANDVLDEVTCDGGREMWTQESWDGFADKRLPRWMQIFEEVGRRHGLSGAGGHMLGTPQPTLADLVTSALWFTLTDKVPQLAPTLENHAPNTAALARRVADTPAIAALRRESDALYGNLYCGGQIEESLRAVLAARSG